MSDATAEKMTSAYIKIRAERSALSAKFKANLQEKALYFYGGYVARSNNEKNDFLEN